MSFESPGAQSKVPAMTAENQSPGNGEPLESDVERAKLLVGLYVATGDRELYTVATPDAIRNWAFGAGDDNPLYVDDEYGIGTRWGSQIGHGTQVGHIKTPMLGDPIPEDIRRATEGIFRGVQQYVSGGVWEWFRALHAGDRVYSYSGQEGIEVKKSEFAGQSCIQTRRDVALNQRGEVIGIFRSFLVLTSGQSARSRGKYTEIEPANYSDDDYARIDAIYENELPRGGSPRYFEDVVIGEALPPMVKGPLTTTEIIAFHMGGFGMLPQGVRASRVSYKNRLRTPQWFNKNGHGVWDVKMRNHWDPEWAKVGGNPMAYDYGAMRQSWFYHHVSDWMGDDGFVETLSDSIRKFSYIGDLQFLSGEVVALRKVGARNLVDLKLRMVNQREVETAHASATVSLPSRSQGLQPLPVVPTEVQRQATSMFVRHNELEAQRRQRT